jgi:hypothetical protein
MPSPIQTHRAATPSPERSPDATRCCPCAARVNVRQGRQWLGAQDRAAGTAPVVAYRHRAITSLRATGDDPNPAGVIPMAKSLSIPLREHAVRLPAHPRPGQLNTDRLQPLVAGATDPLLVRRRPAVVGASVRTPETHRRRVDCGRPATPGPSSSKIDALVVATSSTAPFRCRRVPSRCILMTPDVHRAWSPTRDPAELI